ncbi:BnaA04g25400D [Brassica napus]|uniref:BnaA04g25400D protein n=1 Tax=Brassica napus TaxID=3708 RepID=A0A078GZ70_BRANA|nr:BnaA04g25400D [Brassica napus]
MLLSPLKRRFTVAPKTTSLLLSLISNGVC